MATIYLAQLESGQGPGPIFAVKLIHQHLASDPEFIEMFMDEAEIAAQIRHPNVCAVVDYALRQNEPYIVMEYLLGESLMSVANRIARSADLDAEKLAACVARVLTDACEGLHAAHELSNAEGEPLNVVHRDVSPENVFVTYDGVGKVMDFGVAAAAQKRHRTRAGIVKGKFAAVAPECLRGHKPDRRADVWGVGVIAWELLTGERLFRRDTDVATLAAVNEAPIPRPSERRPGLPAEIDTIVMRALQRDPEARYATARELARDLARVAARDACPVTSADVAEWLSGLFPGGRERRSQIVEIAAQLGAQFHEGTPPRLGSEGSARSASRSISGALSTSVWPGSRPSSRWMESAPPLASDRSAVLGDRRGWGVGLLAFAIASGGAVSAIVTEALVEAWTDSPTEARTSPVPSARLDTKDGLVVRDPNTALPTGDAKTEREVVLRIRVDPERGEDPAMLQVLDIPPPRQSTARPHFAFEPSEP